MKNTLLIVIFCMIPILCSAGQSGTFRDQWGNNLGSWSQNDNRTTYQDQWGNSEGFSSHNDNQEDYYDQWGNSEGSETDNRDRGR